MAGLIAVLRGYADSVWTRLMHVSLQTLVVCTNVCLHVCPSVVLDAVLA